MRRHDLSHSGYLDIMYQSHSYPWRRHLAVFVVHKCVSFTHLFRRPGPASYHCRARAPADPLHRRLCRGGSYCSWSSDHVKSSSACTDAFAPLLQIYDAHCQDADVIKRKRIAESPICADRSQLVRIFAPLDTSQTLTEQPSMPDSLQGFDSMRVSTSPGASSSPGTGPRPLTGMTHHASLPTPRTSREDGRWGMPAAEANGGALANGGYMAHQTVHTAAAVSGRRNLMHVESLPEQVHHGVGGGNPIHRQSAPALPLRSTHVRGQSSGQAGVAPVGRLGNPPAAAVLSTQQRKVARQLSAQRRLQNRSTGAPPIVAVSVACVCAQKQGAARATHDARRPQVPACSSAQEAQHSNQAEKPQHNNHAHPTPAVSGHIPARHPLEG
jgi:hypothetical protein